MKISLLLSVLTFGFLAVAEAPVQLETPTAQQQLIIDQITAGIAQKIRTDFEKTGAAARDAHAKGHGCVKATFTVNADVERTGFNVGAFRTPGKRYESWIRFSNGSGDVLSDDRDAGGRGMAVKVIGVDGPKFMSDESSTQDFQMIDYPSFFVKNVEDYAQFETDPNFFATHPEEAAVIKGLSDPIGHPPKNLAELTFYSMTPRQFGAVTQLHPIKFSAAPVPCDGQTAQPPLALQDSSNALRIALRETLQKRDACFDFRIQRQTNETDMPVNNPVKRWAEKESAFVPVAKIVIPKQAFESNAQMQFCEDLSITPWHSIAEHQPIGSIELARKQIYETTARLRHELNQRPEIEPTGNEQF